MTTSRAIEDKPRVLPGAISRYWDDLEVGERTRSKTMTIRADEMMAFAQKYDPQFFHTDPDAAKGSLFGGLIGSGIFTAAMWRILDHETNGNIAFACGVAWDNVKWRRPVRPGDVLYATSLLVTKRPSAKRRDAGVATFHHEVINQTGEVVLAFDSIDLVYHRPKP
jgi:acyl dehydratase